MLKQFESLSADDRQVMMDAIPLVTILIAGADGKIDHRETLWAEKITRVRSYDADEQLLPFYKEVGKTFHSRLIDLIDELPEDLNDRQKEVANRLAKLNDVFPKVDAFYARAFYKSLKSFARHVAKSSGGILGFLSVSSEEEDWVKLPMLREPEV